MHDTRLTPQTRTVRLHLFLDANRSLLVLTLVTGADVNSSFTLGHSLSCFLVMVWSRKFAGTRVRAGENNTWRFPFCSTLPTLRHVFPRCDLSCGTI